MVTFLLPKHTLYLPKHHGPSSTTLYTYTLKFLQSHNQVRVTGSMCNMTVLMQLYKWLVNLVRIDVIRRLFIYSDSLVNISHIT